MNQPGRIALIAALLGLSSCSYYLEAARPEYKNVSLIRPGIARLVLVQEIGPPRDSYVDEKGRQVDVYKLDPDGQTVSLKVGITAFHVAADIVTAGLWEIIAYPIEEATQHELTTYVITYERDRIALVQYGPEAIQPGYSANKFLAQLAYESRLSDRD